MVKKDQALVVFQDKKIRRVWHNNDWWFSIVDIVGVLTDSPRARKYWVDLKSRIGDEGFQLSAKIGQLKLPATDGKYYATDCANTESLFRIIQSIPSKKAEPFKRWLAKVGYERVQELENPELAQKRMKEISKATFGITPNQYKELKGLQRDNLRDHMNDLELIFTMLGEASTTKIAKKKDAQGFIQNKDAARKGGAVAGVARKKLEKESGEKVVSKENYLNLNQKKKKQLE
jgi:DNA-damage-inducible protein D